MTRPTGILVDVAQPSHPLLQLPGGAGAPREARAAVLSALGDHLSRAAARDVALVVSELVTNSVQHAATGPAQRLGIEVGVWQPGAGSRSATLADRGRRPRPPAGDNPEAPDGLGLMLVDRVARSWAVARDGAGGTRVWCELSRIRRPLIGRP